MSEEEQKYFKSLIGFTFDSDDIRYIEKMIDRKGKEIERLNMRLKTSNDTCDYLRNTIDKAIFFIQSQELHKSKDTTGAITMKERELIDILLGEINNV